jgi:arsenical pump membrane protein
MRPWRLVRCGLVTGPKGIARALSSARLSPLDWVSLGIFAVGLLTVATGLLSVGDASHTLRRILPLLGFLAAVIVLAELTAEAQLFGIVATRLAIIARGSFAAMFVLCVLFAATATATLNLDTTAVLLTPVMLAVARPADIPPVPLAMTTVWLANTASLLLPVSNLTNLLAADRIALAAPAFAARMALPPVATIAATMLFLWVCFWRRGCRGADAYDPPPPLKLATVRERALFRIVAAACLLFVAAIPVLRDQIGLAAAGAAAVAVGAFAALDRSRLRWTLVPWQLLILVTGLFLVVPTLSRYGLAEVMTALIGTDQGPAGLFRAAGAGAGLSNVINNLPAYTAGEAVVPHGAQDMLLALLIGTNVGPIVTPWASLATLLCLEACRRHGLAVPMRTFVLAGFGLAVTALLAGIAALLVTG